MYDQDSRLETDRRQGEEMGRENLSFTTDLNLVSINPNEFPTLDMGEDQLKTKQLEALNHSGYFNTGFNR